MGYYTKARPIRQHRPWAYLLKALGWIMLSAIMASHAFRMADRDEAGAILWGCWALVALIWAGVALARIE